MTRELRVRGAGKTSRNSLIRANPWSRKENEPGEGEGETFYPRAIQKKNYLKTVKKGDTGDGPACRS